MARTPPRTPAPMAVDDKSWKLLDALQADARASLKTLAAAADLSIAATAERLKRLQDAGVLRTTVTEIDAALVGWPVRAVVGITAIGPAKKPLLEKLRKAPEILECHHVAGADSYLMTVVARDLPDLERFLATINGFGETRTSIVFSTPIERRGLVRPGEARKR